MRSLSFGLLGQRRPMSSLCDRMSVMLRRCLVRFVHIDNCQGLRAFVKHLVTRLCSKIGSVCCSPSCSGCLLGQTAATQCQSCGSRQYLTSNNACGQSISVSLL